MISIHKPVQDFLANQREDNLLLFIYRTLYFNFSLVIVLNNHSVKMKLPDTHHYTFRVTQLQNDN